jgi:hypothetical protein
VPPTHGGGQIPGDPLTASDASGLRDRLLRAIADAKKRVSREEVEKLAAQLEKAGVKDAEGNSTSNRNGGEG